MVAKKISVLEAMDRENQSGRSGPPHLDSKRRRVLLARLIQQSHYRLVLRKYESQIDRIAAENLQISEALARIYGQMGSWEIDFEQIKAIKPELFLLKNFLEFIYFATNEVIRELSDDKATI